MRSRVGLLLWLCVASAWAQDPQALRYISDETAITLRENKGMDAAVAGLLTSGTRVELLETDASSGYARVRVGPGREGWVLARYLSTEPAARERLVKVEADLLAQQDRVRKLEAENARLKDLAASSRLAPDSAAANAAAPAESAPRARLVDLFTAAGLVLAGLLTGLLIPLLRGAGQRRRNWSQL